jgi:hypothetical protein
MSTPNNLDNSKWGVQCREIKSDKPIDANAEYETLTKLLDARMARYSSERGLVYGTDMREATIIEILRNVLTDPDAAKRFRKEIFGE